MTWLADHWLDVLGWGGSALLVYSLLQASVLRLRILNAASFSPYNLGFDDGPALHQIGNESGLFPAPARRKRVLMGPAERARIWQVQIHPTRTPLAADVDFTALAERYAASGGDIKNAVLKAAAMAAAEPGPDGAKRIHQRHFARAMEEVLAAKSVMQQSLFDVSGQSGDERLMRAVEVRGARLFSRDEVLEPFAHLKEEEFSGKTFSKALEETLDPARIACRHELGDGSVDRARNQARAQVQIAREPTQGEPVHERGRVENREVVGRTGRS